MPQLLIRRYKKEKKTQSGNKKIVLICQFYITRQTFAQLFCHPNTQI